MESNVSSPVMLRDLAADAMHYFEALPVDDMCQGPPLSYGWSIAAPVPSASDVLRLTLTDGAYELAVKAVDAAGNTDPGNASFAWAIATIPKVNRKL
jgi:hypothetical protein